MLRCYSIYLLLHNFNFIFYRTDSIDDDPELLGPFVSRSEFELEKEEAESRRQHSVSVSDERHVNTTKRGRANATYERKSFMENSKPSTSHAAAEKHGKGSKKVVQWGSKYQQSELQNHLNNELLLVPYSYVWYSDLPD